MSLRRNLCQYDLQHLRHVQQQLLLFFLLLLLQAVGGTVARRPAVLPQPHYFQSVARGFRSFSASRQGGGTRQHNVVGSRHHLLRGAAREPNGLQNRTSAEGEAVRCRGRTQCGASGPAVAPPGAGPRGGLGACLDAS